MSTLRNGMRLDWSCIEISFFNLDIPTKPFSGTGPGSGWDGVVMVVVDGETSAEGSALLSECP